MATNLKCGDTHQDTVARVNALAECVITYFYESVGEGGDMYYPFEEAFREQVSPVF
jgi:hypothetical protein